MDGKEGTVITITASDEIGTAIAERAQREGTTPEWLALDGLRRLFVSSTQSPDDILGLGAHVDAGLSDADLADVENIPAEQ